MSAAEDSLRRLLARHLQSAPLAEVVRLADAMDAEPAKIEIPRKLSVADGRYLRVGPDRHARLAGQVPDDQWFGTLDRETDLVWTHPLGNVEDGQSYSKSLEIARAAQLFGVNCDAPDIRQQLSIIDYDRYDPAVDPDYFKGPYGWYWTKTPAKHPADFAWGVTLGVGGAYRGHQSARNHVRGVVAGQLLGLRY